MATHFTCGPAAKESTCNAGDLGSIPGLGRSPGERKGYLLQYSGLENSTDCRVHGFAKSRTRLSEFHFTMTLQYNLIFCYSLASFLFTSSFILFQLHELPWCSLNKPIASCPRTFVSVVAFP